MIAIVAAPDSRHNPHPKAFTKNNIPNNPYTIDGIPDNVMGSGRTLALHMYVLSCEGLHINQAYATAVVLLLIVLVINAVSSFIAKRITKG